ncbi:hypothetical protein [Streptomyces sp. NPDC004629]|uniref:hypothetical protein n=1 Tax=Streptomyces sp. NPDC004629 TaxID=3364705 RepID=UPI003675AC3E
MTEIFGFGSGIDAVEPQGNDKWWFFKNVQGQVYATCLRSSGGVAWGPKLITSEGGWPALHGTTFAKHIDAVATSRDGWWFFSGRHAVKTNWAGDQKMKGPELITAPDAYPAVEGTRLSQDVSALEGGAGDWWIFKNMDTQVQAVCVDDTNKLWGPNPITDSKAWPALKGTIFENSIDGASRSGDGSGWWFFSGYHAVRTNREGTSITKGPMDITAVEAFPDLKNL